MNPYSYDKWLRPRPNTQWQNLENQKFVDQTPLNRQFDEDEDSSGEEYEEVEDTSDEIPDVEGTENGDGDVFVQVVDEYERGSRLQGSNGNQLVGYEVLESEHNPDDGFALVGRTETSAPNTYSVERGSARQDDVVVARFLTVMEELTVKDQDLHRDSIARLEQFFKMATIDRLEEASREVRGSRILLEDRNFSRKCFRPYPRSMTPKQLYEALLKQRYPATDASNFPIVEAGGRRWVQSLKSDLSVLLSMMKFQSVPRRAGIADAGVNMNATRVWTESSSCQVERRTLYASNPSKWTALVLAATASPTQAPVLFDFFDRYLKFETSISVNVNPYLARMTLSLHLPFYTFRERSYTDLRPDHEGSPLRKSFELPHLYQSEISRESPKSSRWICESQVSLLVSIVDVHGWTAYLFEDTYYKGREPVQYWDSFCSKPSYYYPDALTSGTLDSTRFLEPRVYFLKVFEVRIDQAYKEWRVVVDTLEGIVKRHRPDRVFNASAGLRNRGNGRRDKQILLQQGYSEWISNMTAVVSDQSGQISTTVTAWDEFEKRCAKYFPGDIDSPLETSIGHTFSMIKLLKDRLDGLSQEIAKDQSALSAQLAVENTGTAKFVKALTVISIVMMPMVLDIALFSIQPGVMPFQMNFLAFVESYFALALFFCAAWVILSRWDTFVMFACFTYERMDSAVHVPSRSLRDAILEEHPCRDSDNNIVIPQEYTQMSGAIPVSRSSGWGRFCAGLFLRRGQQEASTTTGEPAGLAAVVFEV